MTWREWADARSRGHPRRRALARAARPRRRRTRGQARARRPAGRLVRVERLPRPHPAPGRGRGRARRARPLGRRIRVGAADRGLAPRALGARARARRLEAHRARGALPDRVRREPRRAHRRSAAPTCSSCSDELNHASIIDGCRLARAECAVARHADPEHVDALLARRRRRAAGSSSPTPSSRWTATSRPSPSSSTCARGAVRSSCSTRPTPCSVPTPMSTSTAIDVDPRRHAVEDARLARWVRGRARRVHRPAREPRALLHLHDGVDARRRGRGARRARDRADRREGDELRARLRSHVERVRPGHPSPIVPVVLGDERVTLGRVGRAARAGDARAGDPPADGARGHVATACRALGGAHRGAGRRARRRARCAFARR